VLTLYIARTDNDRVNKLEEEHGGEIQLSMEWDAVVGIFNIENRRVPLTDFRA
jgi:hypothetical protein